MRVEMLNNAFIEVRQKKPTHQRDCHGLVGILTAERPMWRRLRHLRRGNEVTLRFDETLG